MAIFKKVLIANRGEIALRVLRALQQLDIPSVAIYHDSDKHSPVVRQADETVEIVGESPTAAHLDVQQIIDICQRLGVDGVHPGYGFLSENAGFAKALAAAGITFIGPSADVIELMGDKITSRNFVQESGYPVPPSLTVDSTLLDKSRDEIESLINSVEGMKFPLVVKASAGGGGKGMSIVNSIDELEGTLRVASSEAQKYFGDDRVYLERYFSSARHIEVQILGDGVEAIHIGERECSVQRRFQKIVEEAPSPAFGEEKRMEICEVAVGIAKSANYSSAGTVEFLYTPEGEFFFLEMNTRIQVEHPVTELVYDVDLVAEQIRIAAGNSLSLRQNDIQKDGHAIECRLCAEDAFNDFMPETGKVLYLKEPVGEGVRFDSGLYVNQAITTAFDPMLAKLVVHAPTRELAIERCIAALKQLVLLGIKVNTEYLVKVLEHPQFRCGDIDTAFVNTHAQDLIAEEPTREQQQVVLAAAYLSDRATQLLLEATPEPYAAIGHWRN
ncbi:biotin carboxylase [Pseudomaricurvus alkylphenolicus]|uniref:acetyl-CoA carboxylase biotin carboxylase subunit n=1 Tax=Pseudomaricurvus alkylphenolicus TaxID=1306991 RepID=UPI00141EA92E|nr:biotin carboxylase N-terminal domain-containing protein [Pseudomaricurvus alkylphenolicus]NIB42567.1 biotin carboxylase [Pseudomaricurvus alkylphenolicus]